MSSVDHSHPEHADHGDAHAIGHGHHKPSTHVPHVLPLSTYFKCWGALMVLTAITVGASYVDFGAANLIIAVVIATIKASTVALIFMHLLYDEKFNAIIIASSIIFLGIFVGFTMSDTEARGSGEKIQGERPQNISQPFARTHNEQLIVDKWAPKGAASALTGPPGVIVPKPAVAPTPAPTASEAPAAPEGSAAPAPSGSVAPEGSAAPAPSGSAAPAPSGSAAPSVSAKPAPSGKP